MRVRFLHDAPQVCSVAGQEQPLCLTVAVLAYAATQQLSAAIVLACPKTSHKLTSAYSGVWMTCK